MAVYMPSAFACASRTPISTLWRGWGSEQGSVRLGSQSSGSRSDTTRWYFDPCVSPGGGKPPDSQRNFRSQATSAKAGCPRIPAAVLESNDPVVYAAFLRGLFEADGTVQDGVPSLSTAHEGFAAEVSTLSARPGPGHDDQDDRQRLGRSHLPDPTPERRSRTEIPRASRIHGRA